MLLPPKAILFDELELVDKDKSMTEGAHTVLTMQFVNKGVLQKVFYKPIDKVKYTEERAKYVVASSILLQLSLGKSAAEERLVFEEIPNTSSEKLYRIVGTASFAIPNFLPMKFNDETLPSDPPEREKVAPSLERLLRAPEIAAILIETYALGDDDLHSKNLGHASENKVDELEDEGYFARIDTDRFLNKGAARGIEGYIWGKEREPESIALKFFDNFPNGTGRCHMPSNSTSGTVKSNKKFPKHESFLQLAGKELFHRQMMTASLKKLLMHRPGMIRKHLQDRIGVADPFIDQVMPEIECLYNSFYRAVTFYEGCPKNEQGARVPSFREFLQKTPSAFRTVMESVRHYNQKILDEYDADLAADYLCSEKDVMQHYHQIWRDSHVIKINQLMECLLQLIEAVEHLNPEIQFIKINRSNPVDIANASEASELLRGFTIDTCEMSQENIGSQLFTGLKTNLVTFTTKLQKLFNDYVNIPRANLTEETNLSLVSSFNKIISNNRDIKSALGNGTAEQKHFEEIIRNLYALLDSLNLARHLAATDTVLGATIEAVSYSIPRSHEDTKVVNCCIKHLFAWADELEPEEFKTKIRTIIEQDYKPYTDSRGPEVLAYLERSSETSANQLARILSIRGINDSSLNTCIIKSLLNDMLENRINKIEANLVPARKKLETDKESFNWNHYTKKAQLFAQTNPNVSHVYHPTSIAVFHKKIYEWADALSHKEFEDIIKENILSRYSTWGSLWGNSKHSMIDGMLKNRDENPNIKILATMLAGDQTSNSLSTITFDFLWIRIAQESNKSANKADPEWSKLQLLSDNEVQYYKPLAQSFARDKLTEYETSLVPHRKTSSSYAF